MTAGAAEVCWSGPVGPPDGVDLPHRVHAVHQAPPLPPQEVSWRPSPGTRRESNFVSPSFAQNLVTKKKFSWFFWYTEFVDIIYKQGMFDRPFFNVKPSK